MSSAAGPVTQPSAARSRLRAGGPAGTSAAGTPRAGAGNGRGARGEGYPRCGPPEPPGLRPHEEARLCPDTGTGLREAPGARKGNEKPRDTRRPGNAEWPRSGSVRVGQPRTGKLREALGHTPHPGEACSVPHAIHPRTHRTRRSDGSRSSRHGSAKMAPPPLPPPNAEGKLRCASASGPRARACARTLGAGRRAARPRDPAPATAAAACPEAALRSLCE